MIMDVLDTIILAASAAEPPPGVPPSLGFDDSDDEIKGLTTGISTPSPTPTPPPPPPLLDIVKAKAKAMEEEEEEGKGDLNTPGATTTATEFKFFVPQKKKDGKL